MPGFLIYTLGRIHLTSPFSISPAHCLCNGVFPLHHHWLWEVGRQYSIDSVKPRRIVQIGLKLLNLTGFGRILAIKNEHYAPGLVFIFNHNVTAEPNQKMARTSV